jgi:outer membrane receptor protein involved in Fe transport
MGRAAAALLPLTLALPVAHAQTVRELAELPLDALLDMEVSGPSRFATLRSEAAASVTVITRDEIRALGHRTLSEALRSVRGVMLAGDRTYDYIGIRGFFASGDYNTRVLLLVDGNRINDSLYDQAYLGSEFPLDLDQVERIEFVPGPGSAVYGANALFGVINVITRSPREGSGAHGAIGLGQHGERVLRAGWQRAGADGGWRVAASRSLNDGEALADVTPGAPGLRVPGLDFERRSALHARWDQGPWTASLLHADRLKGAPLGVGQIFGDSTNRYRDTVQLASLQHEQALAADTQLTTRLHAGRYRYVGDYLIDYPPPTHNRDIGRGRWWGLEARVTSTAFSGHRLVVGAEWQRATELLQQNFDVEPGTDAYLDDRRRDRRAALFGEDQWRLGEQWTLHLGARIDQVQQQDRATSPRIALAWRPAPAWSLKLIHGRSFRAPNAYEAYYEVDTTAGYLRNPELRPEHVRGDEFSAEWQPAVGWRLSGSLYRNRASGLLILGFDKDTERYRFDNSGVFASRGAELELEHAVGALRWRVNAGFNQDRSGGSLYPARMLKSTLVLPLAADWRLGAEAAASSRRGAVPGQAVLNLSLSGPLRALDAELQLSARNALDRQLQDPGADTERQPLLPQPRRTLRLELAWPIGR